MSNTPAKKAVPSLSELSNKNKSDESKAADSNEGTKKEEEVTPLPTGPEDKGDQENQKTTFRPEDIAPPVDHTDKSGLKTSVNDKDKSDKAVTSENTVSTVPNKTPAELGAETADQTAARYGIDQKITDEDADNPRVQSYRDTHVNQVPSGTHLHPDIAKDMLNRGISEQHTDNAQVKRTVTEYYDFAPDAEHNDKF